MRFDAPRLACGAALLAPACAAEEASSEPVEFTDLRLEDVVGRRAVLKFDTSRPSTCEARFGEAGGELDRSATDPDMEPGTFAVSHRVPMEDLLPETTYEVVAVAETRDGEVFESEPMTFTTLADGTGTELYDNVALLTAGTTVSGKSSNWSGGADDSSFGVNMAFDGMMNTAWSSDGDGDDAWIEIDLGQERHIVQVGFRSRDMTDGTSIIQEFALSFDGETVGTFESPDSDVSYIYHVPPADVQVVRLEAIKTTGGNTGIRELQLYAPKPE